MAWLDAGKDESPPWLTLGGARAGDRERPYGILGILNLTPDSFYDGGVNAEPAQAIARGLRFLQDGCDIIDLGPESSRPGSLPVGDDVEKGRLAPVLEALAQKLPPAKISVDTWHAATAIYALQNGAGIINDVSACEWEDGMLEALAQYKPGYVLTHNNGLPRVMQRNPQYDDVVEDILAFFERKLNLLVKAGLPEDRIALDPGIGFGKLPAHNMEILRNLSRLLIFGRPLLIGLSMKSFLKKLFPDPHADLACLTATASALAWQKGVFWHRVHDPLKTANALELALAAR